MHPNDDFKALNGEEFMSRIQANHQKVHLLKSEYYL